MKENLCQHQNSRD